MEGARWGRWLIAVLVVGTLAAAAIQLAPAPAQAPRIGDRQIRDRIRGGWVGGIVGAAWGAPTEFRFNGRIVPASRVPPWSARSANRYTFATPKGPDETYVEIPFLRALDRDLEAGWPQWGRALRSTRFPLFAENRRARRNLRLGIRPPGSGDPANNPYAGDIGWQIESDFAGLVAPGQPGAAVDIAWRAGHVIGYGDGVYGGGMVAAMHAEAFRAGNVAEIVQAGREAVPAGTPYRAMIEDVLRWHRRYPGDWKRAWRLIEGRWNAHRPAVKRDPRYVGRELNIDQKLNGAYVLLGLLYGHGDFARTIRVTMRAGQDSDCNPNNAGAIIGTWLGYRRIPVRFRRGLAFDRPIVGTRLTLRGAVRTTYSVARHVTLAGGGEAGPDGWRILDSETVAPPVERWPAPGDPGPAIDAAASVADRTVTFTADAHDPDGIRSYWWSFGDLSDGPGRSPVHAYRTPGTYTATVWVSDGAGRTRTRVVRVEVG
jgi:hypothetical protein